MGLSWCKRRSPDKKNDIVSFEVIGFKKENNHMCHIEVKYENGDEKRYLARVIHKIPKPFFTEQREKWLIDGMHVAVEAYDDDI
jgi:hypothetical protein